MPTLHPAIIEALRNKMLNLERQIALTREAAQSDTKSSAGDKYETSREMAQQEIARLEQQVRLFRDWVFQIEAWSMRKEVDRSRALLGSLIETSQGIFLLGPGFGKLVLGNGQVVFGVSTEAPLGKKLLGCRVGDKVQNGNQIWEILIVITE